MKTSLCAPALIVGLALALGAPSASSQDWPQWRGADRDAKAVGFVPPKAWPKELTPAWKLTVGLGAASPAVAGDRVYLFARQEGNEVTLCLDAASGKEIWRDAYEAKGISGPAAGHSGPRCSPTLSGGKLVTMGVHGVLSCLDAATGKKLWRRDDVSPNLPRFFTSSSPLVTDGLCVAQVGGQGGGGITAFDLSTGEPKWKWTGDGAAYASPALLAVGDVKLVVALTADKIVAIGAADGKLVWETPFAPAQRSYNASTPVIDGATLIYGGGGRGFRAVKFEKQGDAIAAKELWSNSEKSPEFNSPVLRDGLLFALTKNHDFTCIDARDGKAAWTAPAGGGAAAGGGRNRGAGYGSIVDGGTVLLAVTPASELIVFSPDAKAYTEVARIKVASTPIYSHLVVSGNRLLVKDNDSLALFKVE